MTEGKLKYQFVMPDKNEKPPESGISRRSFISSILSGSMICLYPSVSLSQNPNSDTNVLTSSQLQIVRSIQSILFPSDGNGPGSYDIMADKYLLWVLSDERMDPEEKEYIIIGIGWIDETAEELFSKKYNRLSEKQKEELVENISQEKWGISWLGVILNFVFEALLSDPEYGGNPDKIGWNWLDHNPGYPRPDELHLYPEIIKTVNENKQQE